jgi:hypothetical protein
MEIDYYRIMWAVCFGVMLSELLSFLIGSAMALAVTLYRMWNDQD